MSKPPKTDEPSVKDWLDSAPEDTVVHIPAIPVEEPAEPTLDEYEASIVAATHRLAEARRVLAKAEDNLSTANRMQSDAAQHVIEAKTEVGKAQTALRVLI